METVSILLLIALWLLYFGIHSLLASLRVKTAVATNLPALMPWYRLIFNTIALLLLIPPVLVVYQNAGDPLWQWKGVAGLIANLLALGAIGCFVWSLRFYDGAEFLGTRQLRKKTTSVEDQETFCISPLHRLVRHPWYSLALIIIWTREMDSATLISAIMISLYFVIGSRFEEQKLLIYHGEKYRRYKQKVPALLPLPWKYLSQSEAEKLSCSRENEHH